MSAELSTRCRLRWRQIIGDYECPQVALSHCEDLWNCVGRNKRLELTGCGTVLKTISELTVFEAGVGDAGAFAAGASDAESAAVID